MKLIGLALIVAVAVVALFAGGWFPFEMLYDAGHKVLGAAWIVFYFVFCMVIFAGVTE